MRKKGNIWPLVFTAPTMLIFTAIFAVPLVMVFATSLTEYTAFKEPVFIGLRNFIALFTGDKSFIDAVKNTTLWVVLQSTVNVAIGLVVALMLRRKPFGWKFVRTAYMIPNIIPTAATALMFSLIYNPQFGVVASVYDKLGITAAPPNLFGNRNYAFWAVTSVWIAYSALNTILILAEAGSIPKELYESAQIDGASVLQADRYVTLPLLRNILGTCVILQTVGMISQFDMIYMTTRGGPDTVTLNLPVYLFKTSNLEMNYGMANAIGVVQIVYGLLLVLLINRVFGFGRGQD